MFADILLRFAESVWIVSLPGQTSEGGRRRREKESNANCMPFLQKPIPFCQTQRKIQKRVLERRKTRSQSQFLLSVRNAVRIRFSTIAWTASIIIVRV